MDQVTQLTRNCIGGPLVLSLSALSQTTPSTPRDNADPDPSIDLQWSRSYLPVNLKPCLREVGGYGPGYRFLHSRPLSHESEMDCPATGRKTDRLPQRDKKVCLGSRVRQSRSAVPSHRIARLGLGFPPGEKETPPA